MCNVSTVCKYTVITVHQILSLTQTDVMMIMSMVYEVKSKSDHENKTKLSFFE